MTDLIPSEKGLSASSWLNGNPFPTLNLELGTSCVRHKNKEAFDGKAHQKNIEKQLIRNSTAEFLIFTGKSGEQSIEARYEDETIWLSQKLMAELFDVDVRTISEHLKNIFQSNELIEDSVIRKIRITVTDGKRYLTRFYNLDAIISVG